MIQNKQSLPQYFLSGSFKKYKTGESAAEKSIRIFSSAFINLINSNFVIRCLFILFSLRTNRRLFCKVNRTQGKFSTDKIKKEKTLQVSLTSEKISSEVWREFFSIPMKECLLVMFGVAIMRIRIQHFSHKHDGIFCCPLCLYSNPLSFSARARE